MALGILSSIPFAGTSLKAAFEQGYGKTLAYAPPFFESLGYTSSKYSTALQQLNDATNQVTLIVAIGGGVAEKNAASMAHPAQKPTVSLVGGRLQGSPNPHTGLFRDRISLESFNTNLDRRNWLHKHYSIQLNEICLLYNPNSATVSQETPGFQYSVPANNIDENTQSGPASSEFTQAFRQISQIIDRNGNPIIKAVIVSADPWFKQRSAELVAAADRWATGSRRLMYPLQEYADEYANRPHPWVNFYGPKLEDAYYLLGQLARGGKKSDPQQLLDGQPIPPTGLWGRVRDFFARWR
jgi:hypothetical protein